MKFFLLSVTVCLALTGVLAETLAEIEYENPIRSGDDDEIKSLPGLNFQINYKQYSGYLSGDGSNDTRKFVHYWFVESQGNPSTDPVLLWLNGGPGCSSLGGLLTELGPFSVEPDSRTLKPNPYSWNLNANVLFLESPTGVGFSYSKSPIINTDDSTAKLNHNALRSFFDKFPSYKGRELYLSGESYAGVYLPTLAVLCDADPELNLKGVAIGNGYLDVEKLGDSLVLFSYYHGLIGKSLYDKVSKHCCQGKAPSRENCEFGIKAGILCASTVKEVLSVYEENLNPYNVYGSCDSAQVSRNATTSRSLHSSAVSQDAVMRHLRALTLTPHIRRPNYPVRLFKDQTRGNGRSGRNVRSADSERFGDSPPCIDGHVITDYLNQPEVRKALNVPKKLGDWSECSAIAYIMKYPSRPGGLAPQIKSLINSKRDLTLLVYNGDIDSVCNFLGDEWFVDDLGRKVLSDYQFWNVDNQVAGAVKHYEGITYATIRGAGHMVPGDKPKESLVMLKAFLGSKHGNTYL